MGVITQPFVAQAAVLVNRMSQDDKIGLVDQIAARQPTMLASILALARMGVSMEMLDVALHILLVTFKAMEFSGRAWPVVTEDVQEGCLQRLTARMRFNDGLPAALMAQVVHQFCDEHPERHLLAFAYGHLRDHDLLAVRSEAEKSLVLGVFNLVECVAFAGPAAKD